VRREGRLTTGQQRALDELFPRFGILDDGSPLDLPALFGREAPVTLEIGFGDGESLLAIAKAHPERDYIGIEVHRPGVGHLLARMEEEGVENIRVACEDAVELLKKRLPDGSLAQLFLFFPDPWHKKRHHKRRQVQADWAQLVRRKLQLGGILHMATDWEAYAHWMAEVLGAAEGFSNCTQPGPFSPRPDYRPTTKFERRGQRLGHGVWDLLYRRDV